MLENNARKELPHTCYCERHCLFETSDHQVVAPKTCLCCTIRTDAQPYLCRIRVQNTAMEPTECLFVPRVLGYDYVHLVLVKWYVVL